MNMKSIVKPEKIIATDKTIHEIVRQEIKKYGFKADLNHIDVSQVTDMSNLFRFSKFKGDISQWDVSNVTDMSHMFYMSYFNGDVSKWDTSNVINMNCTFNNEYFKGDISHWNIDNLRNLISIFNSTYNQNIFIKDFKYNDEKYNNEKIEISFDFDIKYFNHFNSLIDFLNRTKNKAELYNLFTIYPDYQLIQNRKSFLIFANTIQENKIDLKYIHYLSSSYPLFLCQIGDCEYLKSFKELSLKERMMFLKESNIKSTNYNTNLDSLFLILNAKKYQIKNLAKIFSNNFQIALEKFEELMKVLNKNIDDLPLAKVLFNDLYQIEIKLLKSKNEYYHNYLKQNNQSFSDFYPYYSAIQKKKLLKIISKKNVPTKKIEDLLLVNKNINY